MSAYKTVECDIVDLDILIEAFKLLNLDFEIYDEAECLRGYQNDIRNEKAEIILKKESINYFTGASNDIGFKWNSQLKKYDMIISDYDKKLKMDKRILQAYVKVAIEQALEKNGFKIKVNIQEDDFLKKNLNNMNIVARKII